MPEDDADEDFIDRLCACDADEPNEDDPDASEEPAADETVCDRLALPANLDLAAAIDMRAKCLDVLNAGRDLRIDGAAVARPYTPGLQVLLAAARAARECSQTFVLSNPSSELARALADLGLADEAREWSAAS